MAFCVRLQFIRHRLQTYNMGPVSDISVVGLRFPALAAPVDFRLRFALDQTVDAQFFFQFAVGHLLFRRALHLALLIKLGPAREFGLM